MPAPKGNQYWKLAENIGKNKKFTPKELIEKAIEYVEWVENNPLKANKLFGNGTKGKVKKMRAMSIKAFCAFCGMNESTFNLYSKQNDYSNIINDIKGVFFAQKFEGASSGELKENIIARELGLVDRKDITTDDKPFETKPDLSKLDDKEIIELKKLLSKANNQNNNKES